MRTRCSRPIPRSRKAFPHRSTLAASSPYVTLWPWQRMATLDSRTPRCEATNVSAALYRAGSSIRRGSPTRRIMSRPGTSRRVELDVRVHHLGMLALQPVTEPREEPFGLSGRDVVQHGDAREHEELVRAHLDGAEIDDLVDPRFARDRGAEPVEDLLGRSLADDQPARAPGELVRDVDEDDPDHRAGERIEAVIARQHSEPEPHEADPHHTELLRVRESVVRLVDREDAAAEEEEQRDDERPEVALLAMTERVPLRRGLHAPADADIEED